MKVFDTEVITPQGDLVVSVARIVGMASSVIGDKEEEGFVCEGGEAAWKGGEEGLKITPAGREKSRALEGGIDQSRLAGKEAAFGPSGKEHGPKVGLSVEDQLIGVLGFPVGGKDRKRVVRKTFGAQKIAHHPKVQDVRVEVQTRFRSPIEKESVRKRRGCRGR